MRVIVHPHKIEIVKDEAVNEKEIDISKCYFEFDEEITDDYVKEAYFTLKDNTYKQIIQNNECDFPSEALEEKGDIELGVVAFLVENEEEIKRYNPSPAYFDTWKGSLKEAENSEPITPSDKEQIEQQLLNISTQMDNIDIEASKEEHTTTITITRKDGTSYDVEVLDGEKGDKGDKGDPGAIKMIIVNELPSVGEEDTIYLVPNTDPETQNNYDEYVYVNGQWEKLGGVQVEVDLTDYVKNTDYATTSKAGVIKAGYGLQVRTLGDTQAEVRTYENYQNSNVNLFISKGTLENVITGKGLVSNTDYATTSKAGVIKLNNGYAIGVVANSGDLFAQNITYSGYSSLSVNSFISKGTLENVITGKDLTTKSYVDGLVGDINSVLDAINGEVI